MISSRVIKTFILTLLALLAFSANSVLCRLALGESNIDAASFTIIRLLSGIIMLLLIMALRSSKKSTTNNGSWLSALMLFLYATCFSFAYLSLDTGTGALVLFGSVQITIVAVSLFSGSKLHISEWLGVIFAFIGFVYLLLPDVTTPSFSGFILMSVAGIAWGIYTLRGRAVTEPLRETAFNFTRTLPFILMMALILTVSSYTIQFNYKGFILALISGAITSGIGYMIWYNALRGLSATEAAIVQLLVPVIAAVGGAIFVSDSITTRLAISSVMILGGILVLVLGRFYYVESKIKIQ